MDELESTSVSSVKSKMGSGLVCGKLHEVIITEFIDKYFIIVSDNGKIGTLVHISFETNAINNATSIKSKVLFGKDEPEIHGVAQSIVDVLNIKKPVIFGFSAKEYNSSTAMNIRELIAEILQKNGKENLPNQNNIS